MDNHTRETTIQIQDLTKIYGRIKAVDELNVMVEKGDIYGLVGPNGAGKTTTIRMLAGLVLPTSGDAKIMGHSIRNDLRQASLRTGIMMETPALYPHLSGYDNLLVYSHLLGHPDHRRIEEILEFVGLSKDARRVLKNFSLGMKRRLDLAKVLIKDPEILILDEPTNGLDPLGIQRIHQMIRNLSKEGKTILFSSHLLHDVERLCTKVAFIKKGHIIYEERLDRLAKQLSLVRMQFSEPAIAEKAISDIDHQLIYRVDEDGIILDLSHSNVENILQLLAQGNIYPTEVVVVHDKLESLFFKLVGREENQQ